MHFLSPHDSCRNTLDRLPSSAILEIKIENRVPIKPRDASAGDTADADALISGDLDILVALMAKVL